MKRIWNIYLPSVAISFTAVMVCVSVLNLAEGYENQSNWWILAVFAYSVLMHGLGVLLD